MNVHTDIFFSPICKISDQLIEVEGRWLNEDRDGMIHMDYENEMII